MFKALSSLSSLMKNASAIQGKMGEMQEALARLRVEGEAGAGMVKVEVSGQQKVTAVKIEPSLFQSGDAEMLEDLILAATNQAMDKAKEAAQKEMAKLTEGMDIPGLEQAFSKFGMGGSSPS